eukprot:COSAG06_NODE_2360_length_7005_cov_13.853026_1_plen_35_part_10
MTSGCKVVGGECVVTERGRATVQGGRAREQNLWSV